MFPRMAAVSILSAISPLSAQNLTSAPRNSEVSVKVDDFDETCDSRFAASSPIPGSYEVPSLNKAKGEISEGKPVYAAQDTRTLNTRSAASRDVESVVDLNVLRSPSPYRKVAVSAKGVANEIVANSLQSGLARISAVYREAGKADPGSDCNSIGLSVEQRIRLDPSKVLEIVAAEVGANTRCACEIVKLAITASEADVALVVSIVETAITIAPDTMRIVFQCAIATMPESIVAVQALLAKFVPNSGDGGPSAKSAKSAKGAKAAAIGEPAWPDVLDLPRTPVYLPPPVTPQPVTEVNP
jgi:hypothetical protein